MSAREARRGWARRAWGWALAAVAAGCAGGGGEEPPVTTRAAALQVPGLTPVPCDSSKTPVWDGTPVQLMLADAWAECTVDAFRWPGSNELTYLDLEAALIADDAIIEVFARMQTTLAAWNATTTTGNSAVERWFEARSGTNNCDPAGSSAGSRVAVPLRTRVVIEAATLSNGLDTDERSAGFELRTAGINLCVAQVLRERSPGAAGGEALLLTAEEQRELAAATRERVQIAMLQYALLGSAFAGPTTTVSNNPAIAIPELQRWIAAPKGRTAGTGSLVNLTTDDVRRMGRDFAAAV